MPATRPAKVSVRSSAVTAGAEAQLGAAALVVVLSAKVAVVAATVAAMVVAHCVGRVPNGMAVLLSKPVERDRAWWQMRRSCSRGVAELPPPCQLPPHARDARQQ